jgi:hypothetical protein
MKTLVFPKTIEFQSLLSDPIVQEKATKIYDSSSTSGLRRSDEERWTDALNGIALEEAIIRALRQNHEKDILSPDDWTHDFKAKIGKFTVLVDVKGFFSRWGGNWASISKSEFKHADINTIYMFYDCRDGVGKFIGWAQHFDFEWAKYGPCLHISKLEKSNICDDDLFFE